MPAATLTWLGGYGGSNSATTEYNWSEDGGTTRSALLPHTGDTIIFDGNVSGANCDDFQAIGDSGTGDPGEIGGPPGGGVSVGPFAEVDLIHGYGGTVTYSFPLAADILVMQSGALNPAFGGLDVTVDGTFIWDPQDADNPSGPKGDPTLNDSGYAATLHLIGAAATIDARDVTVQTGDTISLEDGATAVFVEGTVEFTGGDGVDVGEGCTATVAANAQAPNLPVNFDKVTNGPAKITIHPTGFWDVQGDWNSKLPIYNDGGRFQVLATLNATIDSGSSSVAAVYQTANTGGTTELNGGCTLTLKAGTSAGSMDMDGGSLWVRSFKMRTPGEFGMDIIKEDVTIEGTLLVYGGFIQYDVRAIQATDGTGALTRSSTLIVLGDVYWGGGTFNAGYEPTNALCTKWTASGTMYIYGDATVQPVGSGLPTGARTYEIITAGTILGTPANTSTTLSLVYVAPSKINLVYNP